MSSFAQRCGIDSEQRRQALAQASALIRRSGVELVRFAWCDQHGVLRGKTLVASAAERAMRDGIGMVGTLLLKDSSDRTTFRVFEADGPDHLQAFRGAANLVLLADPSTYRQLPWAASTGWVLCQPWYQNASPVPLDTRHVLQQALLRLGERGFGMRCGLEVEFHIYRMTDHGQGGGAELDPEQAAWPGLPPRVSMVHPGYQLLGEACSDMADAALRIVQHTAQGLGLPLLSLEVELGPSQVEAVFDVSDALRAADNMVLFRNGVGQALRRAGYHASFMCRPPFPNVMSSGWHLHQSLVDAASGHNALMCGQPPEPAQDHPASAVLSRTGQHYLAGLLAHARGMAPFCIPTINGYARLQPHAMAPQSAVWARDNRGAMLRVIANPAMDGACFVPDTATRIENRLGEPAANPYLYMAAQIHAGLDGLQRQLQLPAACTQPYGAGDTRLPTSLDEALTALQGDPALVAAFGADFIDYMVTIKRAEVTRHGQASDKTDWERREYFSRP